VLAHPALPHNGPGHLAKPGSGSVWPVIVGMVIAIVVLLTLTVLARRRRSHDRPPNRAAALVEGLAVGRDA
jgi:hypothetical protein